ncbi:putative reverse transcriptase zinc-binding domain-containing protein [Helianthus annuus]|nr:putative reverse transcriptase zinc-binding domain-containing protein [Helianthus annuus]
MRWVKWDKLTRAKEKGGLGIGRIKEFNHAMLVKWWWRIREFPEQLWARVICSIHKTKSNSKIIPVNKSIPGSWKDISTMDEVLAKGGIGIADKLKVSIGDGSKIRFWKDVWVGQAPFRDRFPDIFRLAKNKDGLVSECIAERAIRSQWRWEWVRDPSTATEWLQTGSIMALLQHVAVSDSCDRWVFESEEDSIFSVKGVRKLLASGEVIADNVHPFYWNNWATLKVNYLAWRAVLGKVASKSGLSARGISIQSLLCDRCGYQQEDVDHIFVSCLFARCIW